MRPSPPCARLCAERAPCAADAARAAAPAAPPSSRKRRSPPPEGFGAGNDDGDICDLLSPHGRAAPPPPRAAAAFYTPTAPTPPEEAAGAAGSPAAGGNGITAELRPGGAAACAPAACGAPARRHVTFAEAPAPPAAPVPPVSARLWTYCNARGLQAGPSTAAALERALADGDVAVDTMKHAFDPAGDEEGASMPLRVVLCLEAPQPHRPPPAPALRREGVVAKAYRRAEGAAGPQPPPPLLGGDVEDPSAKAVWRYTDPSGAVQGPFSRAELANWLAHRYLPPELRVWRGESAAGTAGDAAAGSLSLGDLINRPEADTEPAQQLKVLPPPGAALAAAKAVRAALKAAVSDAAKEALQPRYNAGLLDRERFKACVAATVAKVDKAVRLRADASVTRHSFLMRCGPRRLRSAGCSGSGAAALTRRRGRRSRARWSASSAGRSTKRSETHLRLLLHPLRTSCEAAACVSHAPR